MRAAPTLRAPCCAIVGLVVALAASSSPAHEGHGGPHPTGAPAAASSAVPPSSPAAAGSAHGAGPKPVAFRVRPGARADLGWTGISHGQDWPAEQRLRFALDCSADGSRCAALGGSRGDVFGAPVPLSSGGVPACVVNRLRTGVGGHVDVETGCGELSLFLASSVFLGEEVARPCPVCRGDAAPNDGERGGRCEGGSAAGAACDAEGTSALGTTSNDCPPSPAKSAGELAIDLAPLTTGAATLAASLTCKTGGGPDAPRCFCAAQVDANACVGDRCDASGRCPDGPIDGVCSGASHRGCRPGTGREDCEALAAGSGECHVAERPCFGESIEARGHCDPQTPTYVAVFCTPQTGAAALNAAAGLPGPSRLVLPLERME